MRFSLLHPSRNRVALAEKAIAEWTAKFSGTNSLEYILSVDDDDPSAAEYSALAGRYSTRLTINRNRSLVDAANRAAALSDGDLLIVVSDDFGCPPNWDQALENVVGTNLDVAVLVHDGVQGRVLTLPIVGRAFYERRGWVYFPGYRSFYVDDDLTEVAKWEGRLVDARHILFEHRHHCVGKAPLDGTYARRETWREWMLGKRLLLTRRASQFGHRPVSPPHLAIVEGRWALEVAWDAIGRIFRSEDKTP